MHNVLETKVSLFKNYASPEPLEAADLSFILNSTKYKAVIEKVREMTEKHDRDKLKSTLPAFTPSCTCLYRQQSKVIKHSGLIQFDIDEKDNPKISMDALRKELSQVSNIAYCGLSVSGKGLWGLIPIAYPEKHKEHFEYIYNWFKENEINIDKAPSSVVSLRGVSYDSEAYFNPSAELLIQFYVEASKECKQPFHNNGKETVWEQYNQTSDFEDVLLKRGWDIFKRDGNKVYFTRPGKLSGVSAEFDSTIGIFYVFTDSTEFKVNKGYTPFQIFTILEHGSDYKKATNALVSKSFY